MKLADVPVAILAGGLATRLGELTTRIPKSLVSVAGLPFIDHQLALLSRHGCQRIVLCVGHLGEQVVQHVGSGQHHGVKVNYSFDGDRLLGTGGALRRASPLLGELCWVLYGDSYLDFDYGDVLTVFQARSEAALMTVFKNSDRWDRSNVVYHDGVVQRYDKRWAVPEMTYIDYGAGLLRTEVLARLPADEPSDLAEFYRELSSVGQLAGYEVFERFYEIGSFEGLCELEELLAGGRRRTERAP